MLNRTRDPNEKRSARVPWASESMNWTLRARKTKFLKFDWLSNLGIPSTRYRLGESGTFYFSNVKERDVAQRFMEENK